MPLFQTRPRRARLHRSVARLILGASLGLLVLAATAPASVQAGWIPAAPVGSYTPSHIQQMKNNCVWAAGQMLLDKWTHGRVRVSQGELRRASRTKLKSATLVDLSRGIVRATGIILRSSPGFGDPMAWWQLLDRLDRGGGAVIIGLYSRLPAAFTRWNPAFAASPKSGHALYVERYDRARARVWLMDPLAPRDFPGEWIGVETLRRFATFHGQLVLAAATPPRSRPTTAPLTDHAYRLGDPTLTGPAIAGSTVRVRVGLTIGDGFPLPAAHRLVGRWEPILPATDDPPPLARLPIEPAPGDVAIPAPIATTTASAPDRPDKAGFAASLPVPAIPGRYAVSLGLRLPRVRTLARSLGSIEIEVLPPFAGALTLPGPLEVAAGQNFAVKVGLRNIGTVDWRPAPSVDVPPQPNGPPLTTLVLTWRSSEGDDRPAAELAAELAPGGATTFSINLVSPREPGDWTIEVDVVNGVHGALSATGQEPPAMAITVAASLRDAGLVPRR